MLRMSPRCIAEANEELSAHEGICDSCGEACNPVITDHSFDHAFGTEYVYGQGSPCCEADVVEGGVKIVDQQFHTARKSHGFNIGPGDLYRRTVQFHWRTDGPGWFTVQKMKVPAKSFQVGWK